MTGRTFDGRPLTPGVNVDALDIGAGVARAATLGYDDPEGQAVATYALQRWARGEEDGADQTWRGCYPRDFTSWRIILTAAQAAAAGRAVPEPVVTSKVTVRGFNGSDFHVETVNETLGDEPAERLAYYERTRAGIPPGTMLYLARVTTTTTIERITP